MATFIRKKLHRRETLGKLDANNSPTHYSQVRGKCGQCYSFDIADVANVVKTCDGGYYILASGGNNDTFSIERCICDDKFMW